MGMADDRKAAEIWSEMELKDVERKVAEEVETESSGSSEAETESPRSVGRWGQSHAAALSSGAGAVVKEHLHSQVVRIRDEELCILVEDKAAKLWDDHHEDRQDLYRRRLNLVLVSRPILPSSPLSGKVSPVKAVQ